MSGIVGIAHSDGRLVDSELLHRMTRFLAFRGPNARETLLRGGVGLGHAAHLIPGDATRGVGIETLGDSCWITASARLDAREELIASLRMNDQAVLASSTDATLILHSYRAWGEDCLARISGDFSFILWDQWRQEFFCACDHFGIRQMYFAEVGSSFLCSNTLECLRLHSDVSEGLNDDAIADFLLFGMNQCESTTSFRDIQRLARGHYLRWSPAGLRVVKYWEPPTDGQIRYKNPAEYVEHFRELLEKAVSDRTRGEKAGVLLSGGLDSSSLAAFSFNQRQKHESFEFHAFSVVTADPSDADSRAAHTVARALGIPLHCAIADDILIFEQLDSEQFPEPLDDPFAAGMIRQYQQIGMHAPIVLSGEGADNLMDFEPLPHLRGLWRTGHRVQAVQDAGKHLIARFQTPDGLRGPLRRIIVRKGSSARFPGWLNPEFVDRLDLRKRWSEPLPNIPLTVHPQHPRGYASLFFPEWAYMFQREDPAFTKSAVEVRYPFLDLRIVNYLLAIPTMPWFFRKHLLGEAVRGYLPEEIRKRSKVASPEDHLVAAVKMAASVLKSDRLYEQVLEYVSVAALTKPTWESDSESIEARARAWCLNFWLGGNTKQREQLTRMAYA